MSGPNPNDYPGASVRALAEVTPQSERAASTCSECAHYDAHMKGRLDDDTGQYVFERQPRGNCRRFPPSVDGWPIVVPIDWCGEWKAKP